MYEEVPKLQEVVLWSRQIEGDKKAVSLVMEYAHYRVDLQDATVPLCCQVVQVVPDTEAS